MTKNSILIFMKWKNIVNSHSGFIFIIWIKATNRNYCTIYTTMKSKYDDRKAEYQNYLKGSYFNLKKNHCVRIYPHLESLHLQIAGFHYGTE